jgi:hypothetical protein
MARQTPAHRSRIEGHERDRACQAGSTASRELRGRRIRTAAGGSSLRMERIERVVLHPTDPQLPCRKYPPPDRRDDARFACSNGQLVERTRSRGFVWFSDRPRLRPPPVPLASSSKRAIALTPSSLDRGCAVRQPHLSTSGKTQVIDEARFRGFVRFCIRGFVWSYRSRS